MKIGLEIHVQLKTRSKLFCPCSTEYWAEPNTHVCPVCLGLPGSKPFPPNAEALRKAVLIAKALGCKVEEGITFLRKHYFYPDLPSGYQRTSTPVGRNGVFEGVRIREVHLEEDPGRYDIKKGLVDFNRSGVPLVEIVTEPDMESPEEAVHFLEKLKELLEYLGVVLNPSVVFRVDVNVSVKGTRVEVKNVNSIESVRRAILYEVARQRSGEVRRETRHWDEERGVTVSLRVKETEEDYRYTRDPDLLYYVLPDVEIPELPWERKERLVKEYGITPEEAEAIVKDAWMAEVFEKWAERYDKRKVAVILTRLRGEMNYRGIREVDVGSLEKIVEWWDRNEITKEVAHSLIRDLLDGKEVRKPELVTDIEDVVKGVIEEERKAWDDFLKGEEKALNYLIGRVMRETGGKADPRRVRKILLSLREKTL